MLNKSKMSVFHWWLKYSHNHFVGCNVDFDVHVSAHGWVYGF